MWSKFNKTLNLIVKFNLLNSYPTKGYYWIEKLKRLSYNKCRWLGIQTKQVAEEQGFCPTSPWKKKGVREWLGIKSQRIGRQEFKVRRAYLHFDQWEHHAPKGNLHITWNKQIHLFYLVCDE